MSVRLGIGELQRASVGLVSREPITPGAGGAESSKASVADGEARVGSASVADGEARVGSASVADGEARVGSASVADDGFIRWVYGKYADPLLGVAMKLTGGDRHWAEDVVQETLLRAWRHADVLRATGESRSLMPWLATVARRIVINDWRGRGVRPKEVD